MGDVSRWTPADERVVWSARPHPLFIILWRLGATAAAVALAALFAWALSGVGSDDVQRWRTGIVLALIAAAGGVVLWSALEWANQEFVLTEERAVWASGVIRRLVVQVPLERVQNVVVYRSLRERLFRMGTVGLATAGTGSIEIVWPMVRAPASVVQLVNDTTEALKRRQPMTPNSDGTGDASAFVPRNAPAPTGKPVPVIGLSGGIGSGKSEVGRIMAARGCLVIDSDREAKAALDRPEVRDELVRWWGDGVLGPDGRIDRKAVAGIVFGDPAQRQRLESLVHPLVLRSRAEVIARERAVAAAGAPAGRAPARALVIDAPLLFEAGVDRECDVVVFVDAPRQVRLERVQRTRGWDEAELARREAAQLPLEEKRRRSRHIIENVGSVDELERRVESVLQKIEEEAAAAAAPMVAGPPARPA